MSGRVKAPPLSTLTWAFFQVYGVKCDAVCGLAKDLLPWSHFDRTVKANEMTKTKKPKVSLALPLRLLLLPLLLFPPSGLVLLSIVTP